MTGRAQWNRRDGMHRTEPGSPVATTATAPAGSTWLSIPWIAILALTATFHFYRGVPVDGWIFAALAAALTADLVRKSRPGPAPVVSGHLREPARTRPWLVGGALLAVATVVWAVLLWAPQASIGIPAVVGMVGIIMLLLAWPDPTPDPSPAVRSHAAEAAPAGRRRRVRRAAFWWAGVLFFLCVWELGTYFIDRFAPTDEGTYPPLTDLLAPLFVDGSSRWFMTALWLLACAALLRVVRRT
ncbi:hypothetical protein AL755_05065 [Arthrobacter sp. ERGS1:01]|uniref:hypothetical protein n=1 Tax=Arthrobacter sp. ERGS1:01 TaxID=1704044 RepID=UPI0006B459E7|nr:hypothetical protein [Arthrobacter sp. ERGS1:01]ALE05006.1 hypothetical protein AL755_05065 [Arthrobacter sp. ERGS1:01]